MMSVAAGLPSFAAGRDLEPPVRVKVYELPKPGDPSILARARRAVVDAFLAKPENRNVELVPFTGLRAAGLELEAGPLMAIAGGVAPDILYVNFRKSDSYVQEGFLYPLDEYIDPEGKYRVDADTPFSETEVPDALRQRVPAPVWPVIYRAGPDGRKHVWALPISTYVMALMYRKDLFLDAGLDPERPPATWDEFYEAGKRLTDYERGIYGVGLPAARDESWKFMSFLWSAGGEAIVRDPTGQWRAAFDSDEAVVAFDFYRKLVSDPYTKFGKTYRGIAYRDPNLYPMWLQGKIGMTFDYLDSNILSQVNPQLVGIAPAPAGPSGQSASELNCPMMGLSAMTRDLVVRRTAWEFLRYFDGPEARRISTDIYVRNGFGRFANPERLREYGYTEYIRQVPETWVRTFEEALRNGKPEPYGKNCDLIYTELSQPLQEISITDYSGMTDEQRRAAIKRTIVAAVKSTNEKMLGILPPEVERFRSRIALLVAALICASFGFIFYRIYRDFTPEWARGTGWGFRKYPWAYIILLPAVLTVLLWQYVPLIRGSIIALQEYQVVRGGRFTGLDNFAQVLFDRLFWRSLWNSTRYMTLSIVLTFWPPIFLAILLQEVPRGKILFRVLFYLPAVTSGLVMVFLWKNFYEPSDQGLLNQLLLAYDRVFGGLATVPGFGWLAHLEIATQRWLSDPKLAMVCVILPQLWAGIGAGSIIYLAALKAIPESYYEAAEMDGAGFRAKIRHIVIPYLKPLIVINFIGAFIAAFKSAEFIFVMTGGGPALRTHVLGYEIFIRSFLYLKFGIGAAMAWILGSLLIGFTGYQLRILSRLQFKVAGQEEVK
jgi:multiple sugar transport system permease protein